MHKYIFFIFMIFISCNEFQKDQDQVEIKNQPTNLPIDSQPASFKGMNQEISSCVENILLSEFSITMYDFFHFRNAKGDTRLLEDLMESIENIFYLDRLEDIMRFNFRDYQGIYIWQANEFIKKNNDDARIVFRFPSNPILSSVNDMEIEFHSYQETLFSRGEGYDYYYDYNTNDYIKESYEKEKYYIPTQLKGKLSKNDSQILEFSYNASFEDHENGVTISIPNKIDISFQSSSHSILMNYLKANENDFYMNMNISGNACDLKLNSKVVLHSFDLQNDRVDSLENIDFFEVSLSTPSYSIPIEINVDQIEIENRSLLAFKNYFKGKIDKNGVNFANLLMDDIPSSSRSRGILSLEFVNNNFDKATIKQLLYDIGDQMNSNISPYFGCTGFGCNSNVIADFLRDILYIDNMIDDIY